MGVFNDAIKINSVLHIGEFLFIPTLLTLNVIIMDEFENYSMEIDSELIGQDLDNIDPYGEDKFEYEEYDDGGILYE